MAGQGEHERKHLDRYLIPSEEIIFAIRRHWIVLLEPVATVIVAAVLAILIAGAAPRARDVVLAIWIVLVLRLLFKTHEWMEEIFLATDKRLMLVHGLVTRSVDIMPMSKVTDMRYDRSLTGKFLGFGVYILESAGQDQALSRINFVPEPDLHYQQISAVIFAPSQRRLSGKLMPASTGSVLPIAEPEQAWWRRS